MYKIDEVDKNIQTSVIIIKQIMYGKSVYLLNFAVNLELLEKIVSFFKKNQSQDYHSFLQLPVLCQHPV